MNAINARQTTECIVFAIRQHAAGEFVCIENGVGFGYVWEFLQNCLEIFYNKFIIYVHVHYYLIWKCVFMPIHRDT